MSRQMILKNLQHCASELDRPITIDIDGSMTLNDVEVEAQNVEHFNLYGHGREVKVLTTGDGIALIEVYEHSAPFRVPLVCLETFEEVAEREADAMEAYIERNYTEA